MTDSETEEEEKADRQHAWTHTQSNHSIMKARHVGIMRGGVWAFIHSFFLQQAGWSE
jgi:hypothetical protein